MADDTTGDNRFLPGPGQGSHDEGGDFLVQCLVVLLEGVWLLTVGLILAAWILVRYIAYDAWVPEKSESGGDGGRKHD